MSEWIEYRIEDLADFQNQKRVPLSSTERSVRKGNYPYFGASGIVDYIDNYIFDGQFVLISEDGENLRTRKTPIAFKTKRKFWVNNHAHILKCKQDYLNDLIVYYFKNLDLNEFITGAVQPKLNKSSLASIPIFLPEDEIEQKAIAAVLSSLDDKIDLLHRQNKTLEAMAETLFRQWFVEGAKEDWDDGVISDLVDFNPQRKLAKETVAPYFEMSSLSTTTFNPEGWYEREFSSGTKFINGDTLLARITPCLENGKTAYLTILEENQVGWGSTEYIVMRSKNNLHPFFTYTLARNSDFRDFAEGCLAGSSGRQRVEINHLMGYPIKRPSLQIIQQFNAVADSLVPKLHSNAVQIRTLEKLRNTLLPKLMSGEVRVKL